jgi:hypothetical protein
MALIPCSSCRRHVREGASTCPFCAAKLAAVAAAAALALAGCGGKAQPQAEPPPDNTVGEVAPDAGAIDQPPPDDNYDPGPQPQPLYGIDRN